MVHNSPKIISTVEMSPSDAKWITLKKIKYVNQDGKERLWEYAERKTRKSSGVDAVAVFAILKSKTNSFPTSTIIIEQYRPPIGKYIIELPAGLIDEGENAQQAAIRELHEETGYMAEKILHVSPVVVCDPGMTNANMQLVLLTVEMEDGLAVPEPKLEAGEFIVTKVVELAKLQSELEEYNQKGFVVDARLSHIAAGIEMMQMINK